MPRYWAIRTDKNNTAFICNELNHGRLRQGWGYQEDQNHDILRQMKVKGENLSDDQYECWRGNRRLHASEPDGVQLGDILVLPNLPLIGQWYLAKVTGGYKYQVDPNLKDFGHILEVELLNPLMPVNPHSEVVSAPLRASMRNLLRMWNLDYYSADIDDLIRSISAKLAVDIATSWSIEIESIRKEVSDTLLANLKKRYQGSEFEKPIGKILEAIFGKENIQYTAGSSEKGADFICTVINELGAVTVIVVQVKMWEDTVSSLIPLTQIEEAYKNYEKISAGVVMTLADCFTNEFQQKKDQIEKDLNISVKVLDKNAIVSLFLRYLLDLDSTDDDI